MNINRVASPLGAVVAESPVDRNGRPVAERKASVTGSERERERLVTSEVKPSTPTLVVVGDGSGVRENGWVGKARQAMEKEGSGEIRVGLVVGSERGGRGLSPETHGHKYRKSERVVVESVSAASSS